MADERCRKSLYAALGATFHELLTDKETHEKIKLFAYFLLSNENNDKGAVKSMIDLILNNYTKKTIKDPKNDELLI